MSENEDSINNLKINKEFAAKFKHNEKRKKVEKLKSKGKNFRIKKEDENDNENENDNDNESNESEEDSDGELDNEIIRDKFINTLLELKDSKESKKLLENKTPIFTDEDFKEKREKINEKNPENKIYTIKDNLLNDENENDIYSVNYKPKKIEEDKTEKNAFINKVNEEFKDEKSIEEKDFFDNGLLTKKQIQTNFISTSNKNDPNENNNENIESLTLTEVLKNTKIPTKNLNMSLLEKIWGDDNKLSSEDKFLRNYILTEGWIEKDKNKSTLLSKNLLLIDKEDEENEDRFDKFEKEKNFRFEEENGANIVTFGRNNVNSYRHDDTRALKRKEHDERKK